MSVLFNCEGVLLYEYEEPDFNIKAYISASRMNVPESA